MAEKLKRASYRDAINFIAFNDEPLDRDPASAGTYTTSLLVAEIFGTTTERVGRDIVRLREREGI
jgi:phage regulator Rha-like protein